MCCRTARNKPSRPATNLPPRPNTVDMTCMSKHQAGLLACRHPPPSCLPGFPVAFNLDPASDRTYIAQALDSSGLLKKMLITNKAITHFFNTPSKPISYTLHARSLAGSRFEWICRAYSSGGCAGFGPEPDHTGLPVSPAGFKFPDRHLKRGEPYGSRTHVTRDQQTPRIRTQGRDIGCAL